MKALKVLLKVLWVLVSAWSALVFFVAISDEWVNMSWAVKCFAISSVLPTAGAIIWSLPHRWRKGDAGTILAMITGFLGGVALLDGFGLIAIADEDSPVRVSAGIVMIANSIIQFGLIVYKIKTEDNMLVGKRTIARLATHN